MYAFRSSRALPGSGLGPSSEVQEAGSPLQINSFCISFLQCGQLGPRQAEGGREGAREGGREGRREGRRDAEGWRERGVMDTSGGGTKGPRREAREFWHTHTHTHTCPVFLALCSWTTVVDGQ